MELVTGRKGEAHVTSQQDRMLNQGVFGSEAYILNTGKKLKPEVQSSNEIRIRDGALMVQGALSCVKINTYDSITIQNGTQGMKRIDLIVWQYVYNAENDTEYSEWNVIQGIPSENEPHTPEYVQGDIQSGDDFVQVPYLAVHLDEINITEVEMLLEVIPDICTTYKSLTNSVDELNSNLSELIIKRTTSNKVNVSAGAQSYTYITISLPAGYSVLSISAVAAHSTTLCGTASISGNRVYIPYVTTAAQTPETFSAEIVLLKTL